MVTVEALQMVRGDVRRALNLPEGEIIWSDQKEWIRLEILKSLEFNDFRVSQVDVKLNFVSCDFVKCSFQRIRAEQHFWGASDTWQSCSFEGCDLSGMIAPMNSFRSCIFENLNLQKFNPHQTIFSDTIFKNCIIQGMRAQMIKNNQMINTDMMQSNAQLIFRECRFDSVEFRKCYFHDVIFERCIFHETTADQCDFEGVASDIIWWQPQRVEPFTAFLSSALELIARRCGSESAAFKEFEIYLGDYRSGRTTSRDFSAFLYNDRVPYSETQKVIKDLRKLAGSHSL